MYGLSRDVIGRSLIGGTPSILADGCGLVAARRGGAEHDAGHHGCRTHHLARAGRLAERDPAGRGADERLQVEEGAGRLGGHARLPVGEQPERQQCAGQRQGCQRDHGAGGGGRRGRALPHRGHGQGQQRARAELDGGDGGRVTALEQPRLRHDERGRQRDGAEHEEVAGQRRAGPARARDGGHAHEGYRVPAPRDRARRAVPERRGEQRHQHGHRADHQRGVADARALDARVLEQDHRAEADRARSGDAGRQRRAQAAPAGHREQRGGEGEPEHGQPARAQPVERELRQRHGQAPQRAGCGKGEECGAVRLHGTTIIGGRRY
jgi:hypothetical protein